MIRIYSTVKSILDEANSRITNTMEFTDGVTTQWCEPEQELNADLNPIDDRWNIIVLAEHLELLTDLEFETE